MEYLFILTLFLTTSCYFEEKIPLNVIQIAIEDCKNNNGLDYIANEGYILKGVYRYKIVCKNKAVFKEDI